MKSAVILLTIISISLAALLLARSRGSSEKLKSLEAEVTALATQLALAKAKQGESEQAVITLKETLSTKAQDWTTISNQLSLARASLKNAENAAAEQQRNLQLCNQQAAEADRLKAEMARQLKDLTALAEAHEFALSLAREELQAATEDRAILWEELGRTRSEKDRVSYQFNDLLAVREQLVRLQDLEIQKKRTAQGASRGSRLELQQDGTVKLREN